MQAPLTGHARVRMRQRGIRPAQLEALLEHGRTRHLHRDGCEIVFLGKTYAILGRDGTVITVGHRYRRIPRRD